MPFEITLSASSKNGDAHTLRMALLKLSGEVLDVRGHTEIQMDKYEDVTGLATVTVTKFGATK